MEDAGQAVVDPFGGEQGQSAGPVGAPDEGAVGDRVVGAREVGHREDVLQPAPFALADAGRHVGESERQRDRPVADPDDHRLAVVGHQDADLGLVIFAEDVGAGERGAVSTRLVQDAVGDPAIQGEITGGDHHADKGVERLAALGLRAGDEAV